MKNNPIVDSFLYVFMFIIICVSIFINSNLLVFMWENFIIPVFKCNMISLEQSIGLVLTYNMITVGHTTYFPTTEDKLKATLYNAFKPMVFFVLGLALLYYLRYR